MTFSDAAENVWLSCKNSFNLLCEKDLKSPEQHPS